MSNLSVYLDKPVRDLVAPPPLAIADAAKERHRIFALMLMAITRYYWCGEKRGHDGTYPLNPKPTGNAGNFLKADYLGHNIGAIAIDGDGYVIDFDFNHNEIFNSSAEHAEARLVRRIFSLVQVYDSWNLNGPAGPPKHYGNMLNEVTVYTTLESCSQCSGIMAIGMVKEVLYLQSDPQMHLIGNILYWLTKRTDLPSPVPITGRDVGLAHFDELNLGYSEFTKRQKAGIGDPFFLPNNSHPQYSESITSYLCTENAYNIFNVAEKEFDQLTPATLAFPDFKPASSATALSNAECLKEAKDFREYAIRKGKRGTPHK